MAGGMADREGTRRTLRSDAERNRDRLVEAARAAFRELGADAPMKAIATRAGVGTATLYRRFPTRDDLLAYVFADRLTGCEDSVRAALAHPDPWQGLVDHLGHLVALQREDRAFTAVFLRAREGAQTPLRRLLDAAKAAGEVRQDADESDVLLLLKAHDGVLRWTPEPEEESRRLVDCFLRYLRA